MYSIVLYYIILYIILYYIIYYIILYYIMLCYVILITKLAVALSPTASIAQLAEDRTRFAGSRVRFPAGWHKVAFYATGPG